jgi:transposase
VSCGWGGKLVSHTHARTRAHAQSPGSTPSRRRVDAAPPPAAPVSNKAPPQRFVGLDVHREYVVVAAVAADQQLVLPPRRLALDRFAQWVAEHLAPTDAVVLEATTNAWEFYDQLQPLVASVTIAHPYLVKLIVATRVKTDARDTVNLARLLAAGLIPAVWVPPQEVRELRMLVAHRRRLIQQRTRARNRLRSVLHQHNLVPPSGGGLFATEQRGWWSALDVSVTEQLRLRQDLAILDHLEPLLSEVDTELTRLSAIEPWASQMPFLLQLPGMWIVNALILLSAIGDIARFPSPKQLVGYSGLGASVHASGKTQRTGKVTKQGRRELRTALVEAAWVAVERHPYWKEAFARLSARIGKGKAIVAIARRLLVVVWHTLSERSADRHGQTLPIAQKLMRWATFRHVATRQGLSRGAFVRRQLEQLGLGQELDQLPFKGKRLRLPSPEAPPAMVGG